MQVDELASRAYTADLGSIDYKPLTFVHRGYNNSIDKKIGQIIDSKTGYWK